MDRGDVAELFRRPAQLDEQGSGPDIELDRLLGELPWASFATAQLGQRALSGSGDPQAYARLFSLAEMRDAIARAEGLESGFRLRVDTESRGDAAFANKRAISPAELPAVLEAGATVCVNRIHYGSAKLRACLRAVLERTGWRGSVGFNCYLSTDEMGFGPHYDPRHATSLQIAGEKLWTHGSVPALVAPRRAALLDATCAHHVGDARPPTHWERAARLEGEASPDHAQTHLRPGDFLALPAGTWHAARARGFSLALNLYFQHHFFSESLYRIIRPKIDAIEQWRAGWPASPGGARGGQLPAEAREYASARLAELRAILEQIDADHPTVLGAFIAQGTID